jgi:hypothetical protein
MLKLFLIGWTILLSAILLNGIVAKLGLVGWYDFINMLIQKGSNTFDTLRFADYVWLFFAYPMLLGVAYKAGELLYEWLYSLS